MVGLAAPDVSPRQEVAEVLGLAPRTIDRYVAEARRAGLIPGTDKKGATHEQD
jgi:DNA-binding transcriptional regulator LsrR (DeoR family)